MMLLDKPYVSELISNTLEKIQIPVLKLSDVFISNEEKLRMCSIDQFINAYHPELPILVNSENALALIENKLPESSHSQLISLFKDKFSFRDLIKELYPNFYFKKLKLSSPDVERISNDEFPLIVKPMIGYSSVGVYKVDSMNELNQALKQIRLDLDEARDLYPSAMFDEDFILLESWIPGVEYAVDAYFNTDGDPVVLNVFSRVFSKEGDTSDRIYYTSKKVISESIAPVLNFLHLLGNKVKLKDFPMHVELRRTIDDEWIPIEINPLRFAGIGTADLGFYAYDINAYEYFITHKRPNWDAIVNSMDNSIYSFFCLEFPISKTSQENIEIDEVRFASEFENIIEYRKIPDDPTTLAVVFYQSNGMEENQRLIRMDLDSMILEDIYI